MTMNVGELIDRLREYPADMLVVMSKDGEGNGFSPVDDIGYGQYTADSTYSGEYTSWVDDAGTEAFSLEDSNAICLWPTN